MEKVLLVGLGSAGWIIDEGSATKGKSHTYSIREFERFKILAGVEIDSEKRLQWEQAFNVETFSDIESALDTHVFDIIVIATPINSLFNVLKKCLALSPNSRLIVEKPVISNPSDYSELVEISEKDGDRILVNLPRLLAPETALIRKEIGGWKLNGLSGTYSGSYVNTILHVITLVQSLFPLVQVSPILRDDFIDLLFELHGSNLGIMYQNPRIGVSTFDIVFLGEEGKLSYSDGGKRITYNSAGRINEIPNSRSFYQRNVYDFVQLYGFSAAVQISGLQKVLPGIAQMLC